METKTQYTPEQIQEWQKANNMEVFSLAQLCAVLMNFEERQNMLEECHNKLLDAVYDPQINILERIKKLEDKWNNQ